MNNIEALIVKPGGMIDSVKRQLDAVGVDVIGQYKLWHEERDMISGILVAGRMGFTLKLSRGYIRYAISAYREESSQRAYVTVKIIPHATGKRIDIEAVDYRIVEMSVGLAMNTAFSETMEEVLAKLVAYAVTIDETGPCLFEEEPINEGDGANEEVVENADSAEKVAKTAGGGNS